MEIVTDERAIGRRVRFDPDYLAGFQRKLFIEGPLAFRRLTNFFVLILLATVIATFGVITGSTATVIGAMIVAPLMGPIMASAAAVVMGSAERAGRALLLVALGVFSVIALSFILTAITPGITISFTENAELASRVSPGLFALLTALASGAAGAYITSREELADSMGGVAIAISLVPPLCVVGIALEEREFQYALGSLTLFLTNFLAILLAGGVTFMIGGLGGLARGESNLRMRTRAFALIIVATLLVTVPLSLTSYQAVRDSLETRASAEVINTWLEGTSFEPLLVEVEGDRVTTSIVGSGTPPKVPSLADALAVALRRPIIVSVRFIPSEVTASRIPVP